MKFLINSIFVLVIIACFASQGYSQAENEEIMTESSIPAEDIYIDDIVRKRNVVEQRVLPYDPIREADIAWEKRIWRMIDTREKMNLSFRYPEKPFFNIMRELAENGDIALFADESFKEILTQEDLDKIIYSVDTTTVFDYDEYVEKIEVVKNEINWENVVKFRMKEVWFFDEETSTLKSRILGIAPLEDTYDDITGDLKYSLPLFWIYYPEARNYLGKYRVFNEFNDVAPMTWSDLFESRFFSSYIYKTSNVYDLTLDMMYEGYDRAGIDRLLQSKKIKEELFNFEHDLWSY
jgi:gliding motility associated protien GldN